MTRFKKVPRTTPRKPIRLHLNDFAARLDHWSRPLRIGVTTLVAVLWVGLSIVVLSLALPADTFQDPDSAFNVVVGLAVFGIALYGIGWALLVGFDLDPDTPWQASRASTYYVLSGGLVLTLLILGLIVGIFYAFVF